MTYNDNDKIMIGGNENYGNTIENTHTHTQQL